MKTYDLKEVGEFIDWLDSRWAEEGATLEDRLRCFANRCDFYLDETRRWARLIFAGRLELDRAVEERFKEAGQALASRGRSLEAQIKETPWASSGAGELMREAGHRLDRFLSLWVTPQRSVGPAARNGLGRDPEVIARARRKLAELPGRSRGQGAPVTPRRGLLPRP